jgi:hypothetical protein
MNVHKKYFGIAGALIIWVGFWSYMNYITPEESPRNTSSEAEPVFNPNELKWQKCQSVRAEGARLDKVGADLANEAKELQLVWITDEMSKLRDTKKISPAEWKIFSDYVAVDDGLPKFPNNEISSVMQKVVDLGYIEPYLPKNVVDLGTRAALSPKSADYLVGFPECFNELEYSVLESVASLNPVKGAWGNRIEFPFQLIP